MVAGVALLLVSIFPLGLIVAALRDATSYTIPNWLSAGLAILFFPAALALGIPLAAAGLSLAVGIAALAAGVAMFSMRWIGGGDAKLLAASALWLGWPAVNAFLLFTAVAGGALALGLLVVRRTPLAAFVSGPGWIGRLLEPKGDVPYGVAIAVGALAAFPSSLVFHALTSSP